MTAKQQKPVSETGKSSLKSGSEIIVDSLLRHGADTIFGYLGGVVLPLFDKFYGSPIRVIVPRHEQGGCHWQTATHEQAARSALSLQPAAPAPAISLQALRPR